MVRLLLPFVAPSSGRNHFVYLTLRNAVWLKNVPVAQLTVLSTYGTLYEELFPKPFNFGQECFSSLNVFSYISTKIQ